jgi:DNA invertase Pin-like site-specific DNA recombinase
VRHKTYNIALTLSVPKSITRQIEHGKAYAAKKGWSIDDALVFVDDGISGAEFANRPGFMRLMNSLKAARVQLPLCGVATKGHVGVL